MLGAAKAGRLFRLVQHHAAQIPFHGKAPRRKLLLQHHAGHKAFDNFEHLRQVVGDEDLRLHAEFLLCITNDLPRGNGVLVHLDLHTVSSPLSLFWCIYIRAAGPIFCLLPPWTKCALPQTERRRLQNAGGALGACCIYLILKMARSSPDRSFGLFHTIICTALPPSVCPLGLFSGARASPLCAGPTVSYTAAGKNVPHCRQKKRRAGPALAPRGGG